MPMRNVLKTAGICAVLSAILTGIMFASGLVQAISGTSSGLLVLDSTLIVLGIPVGVFLMLGYVALANMWKNTLLRRVAWAWLIAIPIISLMSMLAIWNSSAYLQYAYLVLFILLGIGYVLLGYAILPLKKRLKNRARWLGWLYIVQGIVTITIIAYLLIGALLGIAISVIEATIFFRIAKKSR